VECSLDQEILYLTRSGKDLARKTRRWLRQHPEATLGEVAEQVRELFQLRDLGDLADRPLRDLPECRWIVLGENDRGRIEVQKDVAGMGDVRYVETKG